MNAKIIFAFSLVMVIILIFPGCLKDNITTPFHHNTEDNAKLLFFLEEQGDIINNNPPPMVPASEVFNNLNSYLVIDLRNSNDFNQGHIGGAKNITTDTLLHFIQNNYSLFSKVVLVSASGQSAAYYSGLLRLAGFTNIFYMNYGMASWNTSFSSVWTDRLNTYRFDVTDTNYAKGPYSPLPELNLTSPDKSINDYIKQKISSLIIKGFNENYSISQSSTSITYVSIINRTDEYYLICAGPQMLYSSNIFIENTYHPLNVVFYKVPPDPSDFRSTSYLQTLPINKPIAIYSGTGQESAFYTAYLRLLGYDVKSILFGANNLLYEMLFRSPEIRIFAFTSSSIMNYPYVTGYR